MKWEHRMLQMAALTATWSKDPSTQVGAVIADSSNRPLRPDWAQDIASARDTFAEAGMPLVIVPAPETPQSVWRDVCERSRAIALPASQQKSLVVSEHDCVRVGAALGL